MFGMSSLTDVLAFAILPDGTVRDEGTFLILLAALAGLVGFAIYLRFRKK